MRYCEKLPGKKFDAREKLNNKLIDYVSKSCL